VNSGRRLQALRFARAIAAVGCGTALVCAAASRFSVWFVVVGTAACATTAAAAFYAAYEGFDERLRRRP